MIDSPVPPAVVAGQAMLRGPECDLGTQAAYPFPERRVGCIIGARPSSSSLGMDLKRNRLNISSRAGIRRELDRNR